MISDQEIKDYFEEVIKPMLKGILIVSDLYQQNIMESSQKVTTIKLLEKEIYEALVNIGVEKRRISFSFDGYKFTVNIKQQGEIHFLNIDCAFDIRNENND